MTEQAKKGSKTGIIIIVILLVLAASGGAWYWFMYKPEQEVKEKARLEQIAKEEAEKEAQRKAAELEAQNQAKYEALIIDADSAYAQENWDAARASYSEALALYPDKKYPQDQIALIDIKLDELAALAAKPKIGTIQSLSSPTGRYYVILSSSIDDDLAMDSAKRLAKKGIDVNILETHAEKHTYFAVSPANFGSRAEAEAAISSYSSYGNGIWVLRY